MEVAATALPLNDEEYVYEDARSEECSEVEDADQVSSFTKALIIDYDWSTTTTLGCDNCLFLFFFILFAEILWKQIEGYW